MTCLLLQEKKMIKMESLKLQFYQLRFKTFISKSNKERRQTQEHQNKRQKKLVTSDKIPIG